MKIIHCCLSCFYIDEYNYQENILPIIHSNSGHEVKIIASTETFDDQKNIAFVEPSSYYTKNNIQVIRVGYKRILPKLLMSKIRSYKGVAKLIERFNPDVIFFHGLSAFELLVIASIKKKNPNLRLYVDTHTDIYNSGNSAISKNILHKLFYKTVIHLSLNSIEKVFYISEETRVFAKEIYAIPDNLLEFYPLGGIIMDEKEKYKNRLELEKEYDLNNNTIILSHSGKLDSSKKTKELIIEFRKTTAKNLVLIIIGQIKEEYKNELLPLLNSDSRIKYLGWKSSDELIKVISGSDLYIQPGSQSATMQNSLCVGTPVLLENVPSHHVFNQGNAFLIDKVEEISVILDEIINKPSLLNEMSTKSYILAKELLDYNKLANRVIKP